MAPEEITEFDDDMEDRFAESVIELRKARGWSQEELAHMLVSEGLRDASALLVSRIESKRRKVRLAEAIALSRIFQIPITSMVQRDQVTEVMIRLFDLARRNAESRARFESAAAEYTRVVPDRAKLMLDLVKHLTRRGGLDPNAMETLDYFEDVAQRALFESPARIAAKQPWDAKVESVQRQAPPER